MRLILSEIPEEGKEFIVNSQTAELNETLRDLIGKNPHEARFFVRPLNSKDYELSGKIKTKLAETCSRCGLDIQLDIDSDFREILIPKQIDTRTGKYAKPNHISDVEAEGPDVSEYSGNSFDMGEYLHEVVALAAPYNPVGPENEKGDCSICEMPVRGRSFGYDEEMPEDMQKKPFAALKNLKLN
ncbi:MAG: YceD family protein [Bdellovibrionia bacterium]